MLGQILYGWLLIVGCLDILLVAPAVRRTLHLQTTGRLASTECVLVGLALASSGRLPHPGKLPVVVSIGLFLIDLGLTGYALFLPDNGVIQMAQRWRDR